MQEAVRDKARDLVRGSLGRIARLRALGPNPFDYWIWADETVQALEMVFGRGSAEAAAFGEIVYERGRTVDQRGSFDSMTLGLHGPWGIRARLKRAEAYLDQLVARLSAGG